MGNWLVVGVKEEVTITVWVRVLLKRKLVEKKAICI